jgi:transposase-like protein
LPIDRDFEPLIRIHLPENSPFGVSAIVRKVIRMFASDQKAFKCEEAAYDYVERMVWPNGPVCVHCGNTERIGKLRGQSTKVGTYKCYACRKPFNVKIGTALESTHVPLHIWLQALYLLYACSPGISVHRLHRILGVSSRTTWLMAQRARPIVEGAPALPQDAPEAPEAPAPEREIAAFFNFRKPASARELSARADRRPARADLAG